MTIFVVAVALIGNIFVIKRHAIGFWLWLFADCYFMAYNIFYGDYCQAMVFFLYVIMAFYGAYKWGKEEV